MDALTLLKSQHEEVNALFEEMEDSDDDDDKASLLAEIADLLAAHATIEEKIFYPAAYASATQELLAEAVEEHLAAKRILADLLQMTPDDEQFNAKVKVLKEQIEHHVEEEEDELFPKVKKELAAPVLEGLGAQMEELFEAELETSPAEKIPLETKKAAQIKPAKAAKRQPARS